MATGVYNLRRRYLQGLSHPSWIGNSKTSKVVPTIENTIHGTPFTLLARAIEKMVDIEFPSTNQTNAILTSVQANSVSHPATHGNTKVGRAAGARAWWLIGSMRLNEKFAARDSIIDQIRFMGEKFWKSIQPDIHCNAEFRSGLSIITEPFGSLRLVLAQSKITGATTEAQSKFDSKKHEIELYSRGAGFHPDYLSLASSMGRFEDAAKIICGRPCDRTYTIEVENINGMWMEMTATHVPSPANLVNSFAFANLPQVKGQRKKYHSLFDKFKTEYLKIRNTEPSKVYKNKTKIKKKRKPMTTFNAKTRNAKHLDAIRQLGVRMCYMPPKPSRQDHTTSVAAAGKSNERISEIFTDIATTLITGNPISMGNSKTCKWNLQHILAPPLGCGKVNGLLNEHSHYTFKLENTLQNLTNHGFTQQEVDDVLVICRAVSSGELIVHPKWYGRQTVLSSKMGLLFAARQIDGWIEEEPSTDGILLAAVRAQAKTEQHEGDGRAEHKNSIPIIFYCKIFKTVLGNPEQYFEHFDARINAHPVKPLFSLQGIESFPSTLVAPIEHDETKSPLERALVDCRLLTIREQMQNLATLSVYKNLLQFVIDHQHDLPTHQQCVLRWFAERSTYNPADLEVDTRKSPRKKRKKNSDY